MDSRAFESVALEELQRVPPRFARRVSNVAILIEDMPSSEVCRQEGLGEGETLLGLYRGIPATGRGEGYSGVVPDTITLYRLPLLEEAQTLIDEGRAGEMHEGVCLAIRETLWHELGHHFGLGEEAVHAREVVGTNKFPQQTNRFQPVRPRPKGPPRPLHRAGPGIMGGMAKRFLLIFGCLFTLLGLVGFVSNPLIGAHALFATNAATNWLHLVIGAALLLATRYGR